MELNISLGWNWIKNHFPLTILIVNRTRWPALCCCGGCRGVVCSEISRGVLQTEVLKVPELPDGTQVSLQRWIFLRGRQTGPGVRWADYLPVTASADQTVTWLDYTDSGQEEIMRTTWDLMAWAYSHITGSTSHHITQLNNWTIHTWRELEEECPWWLVQRRVQLILITRFYRNKGKSPDMI